MGFARTELGSGIRVLSEVVPGQRSVQVGAWVAAGSRDEAPDMSGVSHFIEHLVFKGTPSRTALDIAEMFDAVGGDINAYTTKESTCFHTRSLAEDLALCVETIADIVQNATLDADDVESERSVVIEEIAMHEDTPDDIVFDIFTERLWPDDALGRRVQGTVDTIEAISRDRIMAHHRSYYANGDIVIAAAGAVDHDALVALVERGFSASAASRSGARLWTPPAARATLSLEERDIEQAHVVFGVPGISRADERRWALGLMNVALGGGLSSRLFQEIREKRGLAYAVASGHSGYADTGIFSVYAGCTTEHIRDVLEIARAQIDDIAERGITDAELVRAKGHARGALLLSLDEPGALMSHLGKSELLMGEILTVDEMRERIEAVTLDEIRVVAKELFSSHWSLAVIGPRIDADLSDFVGAAA